VCGGTACLASAQDPPELVIDAAVGMKQTRELALSVTPESLVRVNQYTFIGSLGRGSFAEVALARDDTGGRYVRSSFHTCSSVPHSYYCVGWHDMLSLGERVP
jgi:hypothetical protein